MTAAMDADIERIRSDIEQLCSSPRHSGENPGAHQAAASYIADALRGAGCEVSTQQFTVPSEPEPRPGANIIGVLEENAATEKNGEPEQPAVLIGAHYDTVAGSPGADDNASGVAVLLECARVLGQAERHRPVQFVAFDAEEVQTDVGLFGSDAFVARIQHEGAHRPIAAAYILEMVGYSAPDNGQGIPAGLQIVFPRAFDMLVRERFAGNGVVAISNWKSRDASRALENAARAASDGVIMLPMEVPRWLPVPHNLRRSDHEPFWKAGIPAVMIGDTANFRNPHYHRPSDTPETLDYELIGRVARTICAVATNYVSAGPPRPGRARRRQAASPGFPPPSA